MTHAGMEESARSRAGISAALLRVSVGIEDHVDLLADLEAGLTRAAKAQPKPHLRRHAS
jgi:cystathionine gamma-synthase